MAWTGFTSKDFVSSTAGMDYLEQANTDQAKAHRNAMANRAKQEEHAARETAKKQANEARRESNRAAAKQRRASRAASRSKGAADRVAMYLDASLDDNQISAAVQNPNISLEDEVTPIGDPIDYWEPTLTPPQGAAVGSLANRTVLEAGGLSVGATDPSGVAVIKTPEDWEKFIELRASGWYRGGWDTITLPTSTLEGGNLDQVTRHELLHRLVRQLQDLGALEKIPLPEMQSILEKFDISSTGTPTVQDFINFVNMNDPRNLSRTTATGIVPATGKYWGYGEDAPGFDPRMRTAGWKSFDPRDESPEAPWVGSGERGAELYEDWLAFQRELPTEHYGGMRVGGEINQIYSKARGADPFGDEAQLVGLDPRTYPVGPATVNYRGVWGADDSYEKVPISTGSPGIGQEGTPSYRTAAPYFYDPLAGGSPHRELPTNQAYNWNEEEGKWNYYAPGSYSPTYGEGDTGWVSGVRSQTGLGNWPMGDEHALLAAQAAQFDLPGQQDYVSPTGETGSYYGNLARFNRAAALKAHPDSRIRSIAEAGIPNLVLEKLTEVLSSGGDEVWGVLGSYENATKYLDQLMKQYQAGMIPQ